MLEYLAYKKYKAHKEKRSTTPSSTTDVEVSNASTERNGKGKDTQIETDAISPQDEKFLEKSLSTTSLTEAPATLRQRLSTVTDQWSKLRHRKTKDDATPSQSTRETSATGGSTMSKASLRGQTHPGNAEDELLLNEDLLDDEASQRTNLQKLLGAFSMNLSSTKDVSADETSSNLADRVNASLRVSTIKEKTKELMTEFMQILKDIQSGVPLAGDDLLKFFDKHAGDLKTANDSVPSFMKALVWKLLPLSAIPSIDELSKPGALLGLIKGVLQVLKTRFPAFVGGSVLTVMAVVVVMLGLFYAFKRGREEREAQETEFLRVLEPAVPGLGQGRQVEIGVDGVRYVTVLDEDDMRIPCPEDDRGVYWDVKH